MKKSIVLLILLLLPSAAFAAEPLLDQPHWSLEVKGGTFAPALANWAQYYGKRSMTEYSASLAYKLLRQIEVGVGAGSTRAKGQAFAIQHNVSAGGVTYELFPVNAFVLARGVLVDDQVLVPYVGGGFTRIFYRERIQDQETDRGHADGYHVRGGLQLSLNIFDPNASNHMYRDYGVYHTYFFVEAERSRAIVRSVSVNLGGTAYRAGLLFEF